MRPIYLSSQAICDTLDAKAATNDILPVLLTLSKDPVPNVRFNAAKVMGMIAKKVDGRCVASHLELRRVFLPVCCSLSRKNLKVSDVTISSPSCCSLSSRSTATGKIKPALMALGEDKDPDVKFYSAQALAAC